MSDKTKPTVRGRARIDEKKNGRFRIRIGSVHEDQLELILSALDRARKESETDYDAVALTNICVEYLATS